MPYQDRVRGTFSIKALATTHVLYDWDVNLTDGA
jgi:hypothetical protein